MRGESSPDLIEALNRRELDAAFVRPDADCQRLLLQPLPSERLMAALPSEPSSSECGERAPGGVEG
jgi:hypothetical protein